MWLITVSGVERRGEGGVGMGKKACKGLFVTDLRKERSPYMDADDLRWTVDMNNGSHFGAEKLLPVGFPVQLFDQPAAPAAPKMKRVDSYRAPPLKVTLETIEEDKPRYEKPDYLLRSKSLPTRRRLPMDRNGLGVSRLPAYRPGLEGGHLAEEDGYNVAEDCGGDGTFFAGDGTFRAGEGGYGVSISGPIFSTPGNEYHYTRRSHRSRLSITRMRDAIRHSRLRGAFSHILSRMRPSARTRSH